MKMTVYDENGNVIENPDFDRGRVFKTYLSDGNVRYTYQAFSDDELKEKEEADKRPDPLERIAALEEQIEMLLSGVTSDE